MTYNNYWDSMHMLNWLVRGIMLSRGIRYQSSHTPIRGYTYSTTDRLWSILVSYRIRYLFSDAILNVHAMYLVYVLLWYTTQAHDTVRSLCRLSSNPSHSTRFSPWKSGCWDLIWCALSEVSCILRLEYNQFCLIRRLSFFDQRSKKFFTPERGGHIDRLRERYSCVV